MPDNNGQSQNWWNSLPGTLTGIAALITAIGGLIVILNSSGCFNHNTITVNDTVHIPNKDTLTTAQKKARHRAL